MLSKLILLLEGSICGAWQACLTWHLGICAWTPGAWAATTSPRARGTARAHQGGGGEKGCEHCYSFSDDPLVDSARTLLTNCHRQSDRNNRKSWRLHLGDWVSVRLMASAWLTDGHCVPVSSHGPCSGHGHLLCSFLMQTAVPLEQAQLSDLA